MSRGDVTDHSRPGWRSRDILKAAAIVLGLWITLQFLWIVRNVFIICFIGALLGIVMSAATDRLERWRIPRAAGATAILLLGLGAFVGLGFAVGPTIAKQFGELRTRLPEVLERVEKQIGIAPAEIGKEILAQVPQQQEAQPKSGNPGPDATAKTASKPEETAAAPQRASGLRRALASNFGAFRQILFPVATATASFIGAVVIILFVALFIAISPGFYRDGFLRLLPVDRREYARGLLRDLSSTLKQWAFARLLAMIAVGLVVGVSLGVIGVRSAVLLGIIAGLLELIPFFGPVAAAIPAIGMALLDSPRQAVIVAILFLVVQQLEGNLLTPLLLESRVDVPPLLTIVTVTAMTVVLGVAGALVAEPLIATAMLLVRRLWVEDHLEASG
ncbi:MAG TPA: AI-2E family transporter [Thermoanaerobaculia bacterium]|nr:AI-2E family transporter [Thermoanaerobaculia bacterium]